MRRTAISFIVLLITPTSALGQETPLEPEPATSTSSNDDDAGPACTPGAPCCREKAGPPCYCIQELWLDFAGSFDIYYCSTFEAEEDCGTGGAPELWYGNPDPQLGIPQGCIDDGCEDASEYGDKGAEHGMVPLPSHAWELSKANAEQFLTAQFELTKLKYPKLTYLHGQPSPSDPDIKYHIFRDPRYGVVTVIAIPMVIQQGDKYQINRKVHLCLQIQDLDISQVTPIVDQGPIKPGNGSQFRVTYKLQGDSSHREGIVWLKK